METFTKWKNSVPICYPFGVRLTYKQAETLHDTWWERFPEAQAFRANHQSIIAEKVANGDSHSLRWYGQ